MSRARAAASGAALTLALLAPLAGAAQEDPSIGLLEEAAARQARTTRLCADFVQRLEVPLLGEEHVGRGRLCQERPDRFAMRFTEPDGDRIVADGEWLWVYQPSIDDRTVFRSAMDAASAGAYDIHREFLEEPASKYDPTYQGEDVVGGHPTHRIRLVPLTPQSYVSAVVWLDRSSLALRQIRIEDENQSLRTVTLDAIELDGRVPDGWFTFQRPPGVQVITR